MEICNFIIQTEYFQKEKSGQVDIRLYINNIIFNLVLNSFNTMRKIEKTCYCQNRSTLFSIVNRSKPVICEHLPEQFEAFPEALHKNHPHDLTKSNKRMRFYTQ